LKEKKIPLAITNISVGNITSLPHEVLKILEERKKEKKKKSGFDS